MHGNALDDEFREQKTATLGALKERLGERLKECGYSMLQQTIHDVARSASGPDRP